MQKELKDITEEDIKQVITDTGGTVSWQNAILPVGYYAFYYQGGDFPLQRSYYEVKDMAAKSYDELVRNFKGFKEEFGNYTLKYYNHYVKDDVLIIRLCWFTYHNPVEATKQEILDSFNDPRCHQNNQDLKHYYNLYE